MRRHLDLVKAQAVNMLTGNYETSIAAYDENEMHILTMADVMAEGLLNSSIYIRGIERATEIPVVLFLNIYFANLREGYKQQIRGGMSELKVDYKKIIDNITLVSTLGLFTYSKVTYNSDRTNLNQPLTGYITNIS